MEKDLINKRESYHVSIRKNQKNAGIELRRKRFIGEIMNVELLKMDQTEYQESLDALVEKLKGEPNENWNQYIRQIYLFMKEKEIVQEWHWAKLMNQIVLIYYDEYLPLNLTSFGSELLNHIIHTIHYSNPNLSNDIIVSLVEDSICEQLVAVLKSKSVFELREELFLIGNIISENGFIRNRCYDAGIAEVLFKHFQTPDISGQLIDVLTWVAGNIVVHYDDPNQKLKYSLGQLFIGLFGNLMVNYQTSIAVKNTAIYGLFHLSLRNSTDVYNIYSCPGLLNAIIEFAEKQENPSYQIWSLLCKLASSKYTIIPNEMIMKGLPNLIDNIHTRNPSDMVQKLVDKTIFKLIQSSPQNCDAILRSDVMALIFNGCNSEFNSKRLNNLKIMSLIFHMINYSQSEYLLKTFDVLECVTNNLHLSIVSDIKIYCLEILEELLLKNNRVYSSDKSNKITQKLVSSYNIFTVLQNIINNFKMNQELYAKAVDFTELLSNSMNFNEQ